MIQTEPVWSLRKGKTVLKHYEVLKVKRNERTGKITVPGKIHPLQGEIRGLLKTLDKDMEALKAKEVFWFCYNENILITALDQIHTKTTFFLYGFLKSHEVELIKIFLIHTLKMLAAIQTELVSDKLDAILQYANELQADTYYTELKALYGLQIDALIDAHVAITADEVPLYALTGLQGLDKEINRISHSQVTEANQQSKHQLLLALHHFRTQRRDKILTSPVFETYLRCADHEEKQAAAQAVTALIADDVRNVTAFLSSLSCQPEEIAQDRRSILSYLQATEQNRPVIYPPPPEEPISSQPNFLPPLKKLPGYALLGVVVVLFLLLTLGVGIVFLPAIFRKVASYYEKEDSSLNPGPVPWVTEENFITAVDEHFIEPEGLGFQESSEIVPVQWSTSHRVFVMHAWSPQKQVAQKEYPSSEYQLVLRKTNESTVSSSNQPIIWCRVVGDEFYQIPLKMSRKIQAGLMDEVLEKRQERIDELKQRIAQCDSDQQKTNAEFDVQLAERRENIARLAEEVAESREEHTKLAEKSAKLAEEFAESREKDAKLAEEVAESREERAKLAEEVKESREKDAKLAEEVAESREENAKLAEKSATLAEEVAESKGQINILMAQMALLMANMPKPLTSAENTGADESMTSTSKSSSGTKVPTFFSSATSDTSQDAGKDGPKPMTR